MRIPTPPQEQSKYLIQNPLINNQIRAKEIRLIDEDGKQMGVFPLEKALQMAQERNLDLIQITERVEPPVCKIMNYGKYIYWLRKKEKGTKKSSEIKGIRLGFNISLHDLEMRANQAEKFLKKGDRVRIEMILRGREKGLTEFAKKKIRQFFETLEKKISIKVEGELKKGPKGFTMVITKK